MDNPSEYWDKVSLKLKDVFYPRRIYEHYWHSHDELIQKWFNLNKRRNLKILKTDMFEESKSKDFFSYEYAQRHKVVGIDISKFVISNVRPTKNLKLFVADVNKLPFKKNSFDLILSLSTLDHIDSQKLSDIFKQFDKILKKNGQIFLTLDNRHQKLYFFEYLVWKYLVKIYDRDRCYEIKDVREILKYTNFKIVDIDAVMFFPPFLDKLLIFLILVSPKLEPLCNFMAEITVRFVSKFIKNKNARILFGRFICFKLEKL